MAICVKDDVLSSNIQFRIIFMKWENYKFRKSKECYFVYESGVYRTQKRTSKRTKEYLRCDKDMLRKVRFGKLYLTSSK